MKQRRRWQWLRRIDPWDTSVMIGSALTITGLAFVYWPAALLAPGIGLIALGILGARMHVKPKRNDDDEQPLPSV
jgi:hypothetical protein